MSNHRSKLVCTTPSVPALAAGHTRQHASSHLAVRHVRRPCPAANRLNLPATSQLPGTLDRHLGFIPNSRHGPELIQLTHLLPSTCTEQRQRQRTILAGELEYTPHFEATYGPRMLESAARVPTHAHSEQMVIWRRVPTSA